MIILTKEFLENNEHITNIIEKEKQLINSTIENQGTLKSILLEYMQKLADSTDNLNSEHADIILNILNDFKNSLELFRTNINLLNNLLKSLDNISNLENINTFNTTFFEINHTVSKNTLQIENVLHSTLPYYKFTFSESICTSITDKNFPEENNEKQILEIPVNESSIQTIDTTNIVENTLIISETKGKIFLPYTISLLNYILENNSDKYSSIEDVIEKEYTLPFDLFKNPAISRFREAFRLIRRKEKKSIKEAFDLGMELLFNYNLHPAIITACKNLDELDIYLDYLEDNETHKFGCFKIIFDIAPVLVKNNKRS